MENTCPECGLTCGDVNCPYFRFNSLEEAGEYLSKLKVKIDDLAERSKELEKRSEELSKSFWDDPGETLRELNRLKSELCRIKIEHAKMKKEMIAVFTKFLELVFEKVKEKFENNKKVGGDEK
jgi:seryl-tRNA synthetase